MTDSILLIDDDVDVLRVLGTFFEQRGWDVYRELSGEAGVATFERALTDVVLVDLNLPGMDGLEVLEQLRGRETAVIVLTGDGDVPTAVRAMPSGAENFLAQPGRPVATPWGSRPARREGSTPARQSHADRSECQRHGARWTGHLGADA